MIDAGTHDKLLEASNFIKIIESRQSEKIGCIEEASYRNGWMKKTLIYYKKIIIILIVNILKN